jgi:acetolactate synthase-1/2/3 large subunit
MPITKHNFLVTNPADIPRTLAEAFHIASTGRPGPVLVDVAKDALQALTTFDWPTTVDLPGYRPVTKPHGKQIREAARLIVESRRPVPVRRWRRPQGTRVGRAAHAGRAHRHPGRHHADGPRRLPDSHPSTSACPGMHGTVGRGDRRCRSPTC